MGQIIKIGAVQPGVCQLGQRFRPRGFQEGAHRLRQRSPSSPISPADRSSAVSVSGDTGQSFSLLPGSRSRSSPPEVRRAASRVVAWSRIWSVDREGVSAFCRGGSAAEYRVGRLNAQEIGHLRQQIIRDVGKFLRTGSRIEEIPREQAKIPQPFGGRDRGEVRFLPVAPPRADFAHRAVLLCKLVPGNLPACPDQIGQSGLGFRVQVFDQFDQGAGGFCASPRPASLRPCRTSGACKARSQPSAIICRWPRSCFCRLWSRVGIKNSLTVN